jgi:dienelactone hydrolase
MPILILIGESDDWTASEDCERLMERRAGNGATMKLVTYPGAYHGFDLPWYGDGLRSYGHWLKYDPGAAGLSIGEMRDFLASNLSSD